MLNALAEESVGASRTSIASSAFVDPLLRQRCARCTRLTLIRQTHEHERVGVVHGRRYATPYAVVAISRYRLHEEFRHFAAV
jgi:hypothetical protein